MTISRNARLSGIWNNKAISIPTDTRYSRPTDWPTLPSVVANQHKVVGLYGIYSNGYQGKETIRIVISTGGSGTCTIDWGDTTTTIISTVVTASTYSHEYTYSSLTGTVTSDGFKPVIVTVSCGGSMTLIRSSMDGINSTTFYNNLVECVMAGPNMTTNAINGSRTIRYFEHVGNNSVVSSASMFANNYSLEKAIVSWGSANTIGNFSSMFLNCYKLKEFSMNKFSATANTSTCASMFSGCFSLKEIPLFNAGIGQAVGDSHVSMFDGCSIEVIPSFAFSGSLTTSTPLLKLKSISSGMTWPACGSFSILAESLNSFPNMSFVCPAGTNPTITVASYGAIGNISIDVSFAGTLIIGNGTSVGTITRTGAGSNSPLGFDSRNLRTIGTISSNFNLQNIGTKNNCIQRFPGNSVSFASNTTGGGTFIRFVQLRCAPVMAGSIAASGMNSMFASSRIIYIAAIDFTGNGAAGSTLAFLTPTGSVRKIDSTGFVATFSVANNKLQATELNLLYTNLPTVTAKTITVSGNPGTASDNPAIATGKGWTVTG